MVVAANLHLSSPVNTEKLCSVSERSKGYASRMMQCRQKVLPSSDNQGSGARMPLQRP